MSPSCRWGPPRTIKKPRLCGAFLKRLKGLEPSTFCMAKLKRKVRSSKHRGFPYGTGRFSMTVRDGFGTQVVPNKFG
jgi:hypothetical protein